MGRASEGAALRRVTGLLFVVGADVAAGHWLRSHDETARAAHDGRQGGW